MSIKMQTQGVRQVCRGRLWWPGKIRRKKGIWVSHSKSRTSNTQKTYHVISARSSIKHKEHKINVRTSFYKCTLHTCVQIWKFWLCSNSEHFSHCCMTFINTGVYNNFKVFTKWAHMLVKLFIMFKFLASNKLFSGLKRNRLLDFKSGQ